MARYAYVAVVQTVDPAEPQQWEITGDVFGPEVVSEDTAIDAMINGGGGLVQTAKVPVEHLHVVCWSAFETGE